MASGLFSPPRVNRAVDGWEQRSLRSMLSARSERNRSDLPLLTVARERGVFVRSAKDANHNAIPEDLSNYKVARRGDLVINKMKAWQGSLGLAPVDGIVSPAYFVFSTDFAVPEFGEYLLRSKPYVAKFAAASDGVRIGQWDLDIARMREIRVSLPAPDEQTAIVKYLAHANARIDNAIAAKRRLISLLEEAVRGVVARSRGDRGNVERRRLRTFTKMPIGGITPPTGEDQYYNPPEIDWHGPSSFGHTIHLEQASRKVSSKAVKDGVVRVVSAPALAIVVIGATCGKSALIDTPTTTNQQIVSVPLNKDICIPAFIGYQACANEDVWRASASSSTIPILAVETIRSTDFWVPPLNVQRAICSEIEAELRRLEAAQKHFIVKSCFYRSSARGSLLTW